MIDINMTIFILKLYVVYVFSYETYIYCTFRFKLLLLFNFWNLCRLLLVLVITSHTIPIHSEVTHAKPLMSLSISSNFLFVFVIVLNLILHSLHHDIIFVFCHLINIFQLTLSRMFSFIDSLLIHLFVEKNSRLSLHI